MAQSETDLAIPSFRTHPLSGESADRWSTETLREDVLEELGLGVGEAAEGPGISRVSLSRVRHSHARITPNLAVRLGAAGISTARSWLGMQTAVDLAEESRRGTPSVRFLNPAV